MGFTDELVILINLDGFPIGGQKGIQGSFTLLNFGRFAKCLVLRFPLFAGYGPEKTQDNLRQALGVDLPESNLRYINDIGRTCTAIVGSVTHKVEAGHLLLYAACHLPKYPGTPPYML